MNISKLIKELQRLQKKHGDLPVQILDWEQMADGYIAGTDMHLCLDINDMDRISSLTFVDRETAEALR